MNDEETTFGVQLGCFESNETNCAKQTIPKKIKILEYKLKALHPNLIADLMN